MQGAPPPRDPLPIDEVLGSVLKALRDRRQAVVVAPPGAGKTTGIPLALLSAPWLEGRKVLLLEPRRLAARAAAHRMAHLLGEPDVGTTVGYRVRLDTRVSRATRIEVVTEGVLTRMLHADPALSDVGAVLFDEFHERSLVADLGLALALQARELFRPDLRILVMSATLEAEPVAGLMGGAPVVRSEGRAWPVETRWRPRPVEGRVEGAVARTVLEALARDRGDILVFLPGAREIRWTRDRLVEAGLPADVTLHRLHGSLSREAQDAAVRRAPDGRRKVVLSSAIAESSLTIGGIRIVVDAGRMRVPRFDPGTGLTRLETLRVTRDAADQRRGRAGREGPGVCYRLWTRTEERGLVPTRTPEILEADLAPLALELAVWGAEPNDLRWLDTPPEGAWASAHRLLRDLGLLEASGKPSAEGREVAALGTHPRIGLLLLRARTLEQPRLGCEIAALLGERDLLRADGRATDADLLHPLEQLRGTRGAAPPGHRVDRGALARARREVRHWERRLPGSSGPGRPGDITQAGRLAALAFPDRVGRLREGARGRFLLRNGRGARLEGSPTLEAAEWIVALELEGRGREARIFRALALDAETVEEVFGPVLAPEEEVFWDQEAGRVRARTVRRLGAIVFSEGNLPNAAPDRIAHALLEGIRREGLDRLPWNAELLQLRGRLSFLHGLEPEAWPDRSEAGLRDSLERWLLPHLAGAGQGCPRALGDVPVKLLREALLTGIPWDLRSQLASLAPTHLEVPSGSTLPVDYSDPSAPALAVRLQEIFGLTETPRLGGGRVPLTLRLLSPAHRPVQVTRDLASFWRDTYFEVRRDLRGRYPKHPWPEDPLRAEPTRRTKRRP